MKAHFIYIEGTEVEVVETDTMPDNIFTFREKSAAIKSAIKKHEIILAKLRELRDAENAL